jgi:methanogenic corrinoid protein MtbC1
MALLTPHLKTDKVKMAGKVVLGTVQGDIHDIGKNIVVALLKANGYAALEQDDVIRVGLWDQFVNEEIKYEEA